MASPSRDEGGEKAAMVTDSRYSRFEALGACLPSAVQSSADLAAQVTEVPRLFLERITGVAERRVADMDAGEDSFHLALAAARDALARSRYDAAQLDVVISASISRAKGGDNLHFEPSFARMLCEDLGAHSAINFDISNACAGMITGVYVLDRMIRDGLVRNGMVVSGEHITSVARTAAAELRSVRDPQFASLTVGDSAAAVILDESRDDADRIHYVEMMTCSEYSHLCKGMPR